MRFEKSFIRFLQKKEDRALIIFNNYFVSDSYVRLSASLPFFFNV